MSELINDELVEQITAFVSEKYPEFIGSLPHIVVPPTREDIIARFPETDGCETLSKEDAAFFGCFTRYSYFWCLMESGNTVNFANMICERQAARGMTDDVFFAGMPMLRDQFRTEEEMNRRIAAARAQGYNPSPYDIYMPGLADSVGDRKAFVSRTDGRRHVEKVLASKGMTISRDSGVICERQDPGPGVQLAEDAIAEKAAQLVATDPSAGKLKRQELRERVIEKHGMPKLEG